MELEQIVRSRRTIRRYLQKPVPERELRRLLEFARLTSCGGNRQLLRFIVARTPELVQKLFAITAWAGLVRPRRTPEWGVSAPLCFIAVTAPREGGEILHADAGAAIQTMQLAAADRGLGCCWLGAFDHGAADRLLELPPERKTLYLLAAGYPGEAPVSETTEDPAQVAYYLDDKDVLHVPKLSVDALADWR